MDTMTAVSRIVVATDFSAGSERAWDLAQRLAVAHAAELCLVHVLPVTPIDIEARLQQEEQRAELRARAAQHQLAILREDQVAAGTPEPKVTGVFEGPLAGDRIEGFSSAGRQWAALLERWADDGRARGCKVNTELRTGVAAREIVAAAKEHEADLVVIANHGHGNIHRLLIGSVADRVIRMAPCPVLTVKAA